MSSTRYGISWKIQRVRNITTLPYFFFLSLYYFCNTLLTGILPSCSDFECPTLHYLLVFYREKPILKHPLEIQQRLFRPAEVSIQPCRQAWVPVTMVYEASAGQHVVCIVRRSVGLGCCSRCLLHKKVFRYRPITSEYLRTISLLETVCHLLTFAWSECWKEIRILRFFFLWTIFFHRQLGLFSILLPVSTKRIWLTGTT